MLNPLPFMIDKLYNYKKLNPIEWNDYELKGWNFQILTPFSSPIDGTLYGKNCKNSHTTVLSFRYMKYYHTFRFELEFENALKLYCDMDTQWDFMTNNELINYLKVDWNSRFINNPQLHTNMKKFDSVLKTNLTLYDEFLVVLNMLKDIWKIYIDHELLHVPVQLPSASRGIQT